MSLAIKTFCVILILGCAGLFIIKKPDGTPILSTEELLPDIASIMSDVKKFISHAKDTTASIGSSTERDIKENEGKQPQSNVYRWKDTNGQWQFSDIPPTNQAAEAISVSGNLNKDLAASNEPPEKPTTANNTTGDDATTTESVIPMTVSPDKVSKLMKDVNNIQKLMDDHGDKLKQY
jgi:hypothetical protein